MRFRKLIFLYFQNFANDARRVGNLTKISENFLKELKAEETANNSRNK